MVRPGGHFLSTNPANNYMGHGFYQFSPELYFRIFSEENGFLLEKLALCELHRNRWRRVKDPKQVGSRAVLCNRHPVGMFVQARKISDVTPFSEVPQQSDYSRKWQSAGERQADANSVKTYAGRRSRLKNSWRRIEKLFKPTYRSKFFRRDRSYG